MDLTNVVLVIEKHWGRNFHYSVIGGCGGEQMLPLNPKGARLRARCVAVFDEHLHVLVLWPVHKALANLTIHAHHNALFSVSMGHTSCWSLVYRDALRQQPGHILLMSVYICKLKTEEQALIQCFSYLTVGVRGSW